MIRCRCPKCHQGQLFTDPNPYHFRNLDKMVDACSSCGFSLKDEIGFHWFSMYSSYGISILISILDYLWFGAIFGWSNILVYVIVNAVILLALWPFVFRWARMVSIFLSLKLDLK